MELHIAGRAVGHWLFSLRSRLDFGAAGEGSKLAPAGVALAGMGRRRRLHTDFLRSVEGRLPGIEHAIYDLVGRPGPEQVALGTSVAEVYGP